MVLYEDQWHFGLPNKWQPSVSACSVMDHESRYEQVTYYSYSNGLEPAPSDCEWMVPGTYQLD